MLRQLATLQGVDVDDQNYFDDFPRRVRGFKVRYMDRGPKVQWRICQECLAAISSQRLFLVTSNAWRETPGVTEADLASLRDESCAGAKKVGDKTSGKKQKSLAQAEQARIEKYLLKEIDREPTAGYQRMLYAENLSHLLRANLV